MSRYKVIIKEEAQSDLKKLLHDEPKTYQKALRFIGELYDHPKTGLGHPEPFATMFSHTSSTVYPGHIFQPYFSELHPKL